MTYVLPTQNETTLAAMYIWANNSSGGIMGMGILLIVLSVVFFGTKRYGATTTHSLLMGLVTTSLVCGALSLAGVISQTVLGIVLIATAMMYFYSYHD